MSFLKRNDPNKYSEIEHLKELRKRVGLSIFTFFIIFVICIWKSEFILHNLLNLGYSCGYEFVALSPQETLLQELRFSAIIALFLSLPIILFEISAFIMPVFYKKKKTIILLFVSELFFILFFITGIIFSIKILLPFVFTYLQTISSKVGISETISLSEFTSFTITIITIIGFVFEMPLVSIVMTRVNIIDDKKLRAWRKYVVVFFAILSALITPPDPLSMMMVLIPMMLLYEISIVISKIFRRKEEKKPCRTM